jgi:hypothetical protein
VNTVHSKNGFHLLSIFCVLHYDKWHTISVHVILWPCEAGGDAEV